MSNMFFVGQCVDWPYIQNQIEESIKSGASSEESDVLTMIDYLVPQTDWAHVTMTNVPFEQIWTIRIVTKNNFCCFHIRLKRSIHDQLSREAYILWELNGRPADKDEELWVQAKTRLEENYKTWQNLYGG